MPVVNMEFSGSVSNLSGFEILSFKVFTSYIAKLIYSEVLFYLVNITGILNVL